MALFKNLFKKEEKTTTIHHKGFHELIIKDVKHLTEDAIQVIFDVPSDLKETFRFIPGQYITICVNINGKEERRSYSICSAKNEDLAIAIKAVSNGTVSKWAKETLQAGDTILVSIPEGNFQLKTDYQTVVALAAGSGITPILSIAKELVASNRKLTLFYGNKTESNILFKGDLDQLTTVTKHYYLTQETKEGFQVGRLTKDNISSAIKADLDLLKADAYFLCGPEEMIIAGKDVLTLFGVPKEKIHFELFTTPIHLIEKKEEVNDFKGLSKIKVVLDDETIEMQLKSDGKSILDAVSSEGYDPPYSCRGAVCCTCKAKVLKGKATMKMNYSLTDQEVADGYILTCQAHPASEELVISYDEK
jgi:ring-1,2-phenylacetyl-CoA epoxidase subunit PaaE